MDWKLVFRASLLLIPQLDQAINWIKKNVKRYYVSGSGNKILIEVEINDKNNLDEVVRYLTEFLELITDRKPSRKH